MLVSCSQYTKLSWTLKFIPEGFYIKGRARSKSRKSFLTSVSRFIANFNLVSEEVPLKWVMCTLCYFTVLSVFMLCNLKHILKFKQILTAVLNFKSQPSDYSLALADIAFDHKST